MPAGRPTSYKPEYSEQVIEWGRLGKSQTWMAAQIGVPRQRLHEWQKQHPEFRDAITYALTLSQQWWEDRGQENLMAQHFQSSMWSRSMSARFPDEWTEKKGVDMGGALNVQVTEIKRTIVDPNDSGHSDA